MITFIISLIILILGFFFYGKLTEKIFSPTDEKTPALKNQDGIDYVPMKTWRVFLIQLLNIAGTGPIFGALMGAVFGPVVFLWIVFGSILGGAVHDYFSGMISIRLNGATLPEIIGKYLGNVVKQVMRVFSLLLFILVGAVFVTSPAELLSFLTPEFMNKYFWIVVILIYYILATLLPIDKLIGKIYPIFGIILFVMALSIGGGLIIGGYQIPEMSLVNMNPNNLPAWPFMFITVACGAVSGFHATQSPMMARCIKSEKDGRKVFYGAMIAEAIIALIWAAAGVAFYGSTESLQNALSNMGQSGVVYDVSTNLIGAIGGTLAVIGVVICPITTGDTAFRSARLAIADWFKLDQSRLKQRLYITVPVLGVGAILTQVDFQILWRYFSWSNQTLAMITLWSLSVYITINGKKLWYSLITAIPAMFMSAVSLTYILMADEGFRINSEISYPLGVLFSFICFIVFAYKCLLKKKDVCDIVVK